MVVVSNGRSGHRLRTLQLVGIRTVRDWIVCVKLPSPLREYPPVWVVCGTSVLRFDYRFWGVSCARDILLKGVFDWLTNPGMAVRLSSRSKTPSNAVSASVEARRTRRANPPRNPTLGSVARRRLSTSRIPRQYLSFDIFVVSNAYDEHRFLVVWQRRREGEGPWQVV